MLTLVPFIPLPITSPSRTKTHPTGVSSDLSAISAMSIALRMKAAWYSLSSMWQFRIEGTSTAVMIAKYFWWSWLVGLDFLGIEWDLGGLGGCVADALYGLLLIHYFVVERSVLRDVCVDGVVMNSFIGWFKNLAGASRCTVPTVCLRLRVSTSLWLMNMYGIDLYTASTSIYYVMFFACYVWTLMYCYSCITKDMLMLSCRR